MKIYQQKILKNLYIGIIINCKRKSWDVIEIDKIVIYICKVLSMIMKALGGGSSLPGKIALKIRPGILKSAAKGYRIIMVTGTNGKTTTSALITGILENAGIKVISNTSGANMIDGIVTCFINNYKKANWAVIECDEAYTRIVNRYVKPEYMVITNVFRDQLDRFGEVANTWGKIKDAISISPKTKLVVNGDLPLFSKIDAENPIYYFGFSEGFAKMGEDTDTEFCPVCEERLRYRYITVKNLGEYYCPGCGFERPKIDFTLEKMENLTTESSEITVCGIKINLSVAGIYNMYNALSAFAVTSLAGVSHALIKAGIEKQQRCFGRDEIIDVGGNKLRMSLIKNPTGCDLVIDTITLSKEKCNLLVVLNDNWGDGTDVSWVWDAHFERLTAMDTEKIIIGGKRRFDMAIRLITAGFPEEKFILCENDDEMIEAVKNSGVRVFALCTYTGMMNLRKTLYLKGFAKEMWK